MMRPRMNDAIGDAFDVLLDGRQHFVSTDGLPGR
jgi:hypothetical protein